MHRNVTKLLIGTAMAIALCCASAVAQEPRRIKSQVQPSVPEMAQIMRLKGMVRLEIEIAADGTVRSTKPLGGHPLLIQSAEQAVRKWRYTPGPPSKTIVEFNFARTEGVSR
jgi:TonB family protein